MSYYKFYSASFSPILSCCPLLWESEWTVTEASPAEQSTFLQLWLSQTTTFWPMRIWAGGTHLLWFRYPFSLCTDLTDMLVKLAKLLQVSEPGGPFWLVRNHPIQPWLAVHSVFVLKSTLLPTVYAIISLHVEHCHISQHRSLSADFLFDRKLWIFSGKDNIVDMCKNNIDNSARNGMTIKIHKHVRVTTESANNFYCTVKK